MSVRIVDSLPELGGQLTALYPEKYVYNVPGFHKILAKDLAHEMIKQGVQFGPHLALDETALELISTDNGYIVKTESGKELPTRTVIISAGAGAFTPPKSASFEKKNSQDQGVHYGVRDKSAFKGKKVAIVGGGDSAFDWALNLLDVAGDITLIHRRDVFRAHEETVKQVQTAASK